ncbi:MAG: hypothetical protein WA948_11165 [Pontixanthobacter sp.]
MANRLIERIMHGPAKDTPVPLGGTRAEAMQRLQIGLTGIVSMILLVALAATLRDRADQTDAVTVAEAEMPIEIVEEPAVQSDPLAEAGVVPDLPADNAEAAAQNTPVLPEQGTARPAAAQNRQPLTNRSSNTRPAQRRNDGSRAN